MRARQLAPLVRDTNARPAERSIMHLEVPKICAQITRCPQAGKAVNDELARQGWYPGRPAVGGSLKMLAALIGSRVDRVNLGPPSGC